MYPHMKYGCPGFIGIPYHDFMQHRWRVMESTDLQQQTILNRVLGGVLVYCQTLIQNGNLGNGVLLVNIPLPPVRMDHQQYP